MTGPRQKHPSTRARRNNPTAGFTSLPSGGRKGKTPTWPLPPDAKTTALLELAQDRIASLTAELEQAEDGRTKGRLRRQLAQAEQSTAILSLQAEQQGDLEAELWAMLWGTPQAKLWEVSPAFERTLAQFVRWNVKGEQGDLEAAKEARIRAKEFGLTPLTLLGLKAEVERVEEAEERGNRRRSQTQPAKPKRGKGDDPRGGLFAVS
jgi:hypothetical protein